ncbi:DUF5946 family protein [Blastococcus sp. SYSU DS0619]
MAECGDCGADISSATCSELFLDLLAMDHSRQPPWGPLHGVVVAAFFLQHPSDPQASPSQQAFGLELLHDYLRGGAPRLAGASKRARRDNSHRSSARRSPKSAPEVVVERPNDGRRFTTTLHDVAVNGTFPAAGHEERVHAWARSVAETYAVTAGRPDT